MCTKAGNLDGTTVRHFLSWLRILRRTEAWIKPAADRKYQVSDHDSYALNQPLSASYFGLPITASQKSTLNDTLLLPSKITKTRGTPRHSTTADTEAAAVLDANPVDPQPSFQVDAKAFIFFPAIFFNPEVTSPSGEVL